MAVHEGLCTNCGSLMRLNDEHPQTHCIFCWADVDTAEAIRLGQGAGDHVFPNETYPEPDLETQGKALKAQGLGASNIVQAPRQTVAAPSRRQEGKLTPREKVALQNKPVVKPYVSKQHRIAIIAGVVAFLLLIAAIAVPVYLTRENKRDMLRAELPQYLEFAGDENRFHIERQRNSRVTIASPKAITEEEAVTAFEGYAETYARVYAIDLAKAKDRIELRLIDSETGGYDVRMVNDEVRVTDLD